jgi:hypothetical protein
MWSTLLPLRAHGCHGFCYLTLALAPFRYTTSDALSMFCFRAAMQAPDDEPVWRQIVRWHVKHGDLDVALQAADALAESYDNQPGVVQQQKQQQQQEQKGSSPWV